MYTFITRKPFVRNPSSVTRRRRALCDFLFPRRRRRVPIKKPVRVLNPAKTFTHNVLIIFYATVQIIRAGRVGVGDGVPLSGRVFKISFMQSHTGENGLNPTTDTRLLARSNYIYGILSVRIANRSKSYCRHCCATAEPHLRPAMGGHNE